MPLFHTLEIKLSKRGVPVRAILFSTLFSYIAVIFSYISPDKIFLFLINSSGAVALLMYLVICFSQLRMRKKLERENPNSPEGKIWLYPYLTYFTIVCISSI
jgi:GABA permease